MKRALVAVLATLSGCAWAGDAAEGLRLAESERCVECHGADGQSHAEAGQALPPRLAGQRAEYLAKQLHDFRSGQRVHDVMRVMARSLDDTQMRALAAHFAALPAMRAAGSGTPPRTPTAYAAPTPHSPACATCHGDRGQGSEAGPRLAGQNRAYLERQLRDWRAGWRRNDSGGAMNRAAAALTDAQIDTLAATLEAWGR